MNKPAAEVKCCRQTEIVPMLLAVFFGLKYVRKNVFKAISKFGNSILRRDDIMKALDKGFNEGIDGDMIVHLGEELVATESLANSFNEFGGSDPWRIMVI